MIKYLKNLSQKKVEEFGAQYVPFGIFGIINYPTSFFILYYWGVQKGESLSLRMGAALLCVPLIFKDKWPNRLKPYLPLYWYSVLLCCIPAFATYMLITNCFSAEWAMNTVLGLFWLSLLVDWISFIFLIILGVPLGILIYIIIYRDIEVFYLLQTNQQLLFTAYMFFYAFILGLIFARNKLALENSKKAAYWQERASILSASIAHEMRTPFATMRAISDNLEDFIQDYQESSHPLKKSDIAFLQQTATDLKDLSVRSNHTINMMLQNLRRETSSFNLETLSMHQCVEESLHLYPFLPGEQKLIHKNLEEDFQFIGDKELLKHILFNLLANSLYFIQAENKGEIWIILQRGSEDSKYNTLFFKDTAKGIPAADIPHLFTQFYSKRPHGTGVGLAFSQQAMQAMEGKIACHSIEGKYVTFELLLPKVHPSLVHSKKIK